MTDIPTLVEVVSRGGVVTWHVLASWGLRVLKPYADFEDACQVAGEVAHFFQKVPYPETTTAPAQGGGR